MATLQLPPYLDLPPHLSAQKYFFVCTLTVAAWDSLVLTPRTWRLLKTSEVSLLKNLFYFLRLLMPIEFTIVGVGFFDTRISQTVCQRFYLFEPICTAILLAACSAVHVIRVNAIYDKNKTVLAGLGALFIAQVAVTAVSSAFYHSVPLLDGQGCIAGPKSEWVGVYWAVTTLFYTTSFGLAVMRSFDSLKDKPLNLWKLMLRDGLNLYGAIWVINLITVIFWFAITPTGPEDPIRTMITSLAAVLTTSMTLRIILSVRGTLVSGGTFNGSSSAQSTSQGSRVLSTSRSAGDSRGPNMFTLDDVRSKPESEWIDDNKSSVNDRKGVLTIDPTEPEVEAGNIGVKVTINREVGYEGAYGRAK